MSDKKYFVLMENGKDTSQVFASKQPRGAALKLQPADTRTYAYVSVEQKESTSSPEASPWLISQPMDLLGFLTRSRRQT